MRFAFKHAITRYVVSLSRQMSAIMLTMKMQIGGVRESGLILPITPPSPPGVATIANYYEYFYS